MSDLYHDKYRIPSARLRCWDYGSSGFYFVTICTYNRICHFGDVWRDNDGQYSVALSEIGKIVRDCWLDIPNHFPFVILDEFIVIPNHIHGIIVIGQNKHQRTGRDAINRVSTNRPIINKRVGGVTGMHNPMLRQTLGTIMRWYKGRTSFECHKRNLDFQWQSRYYDRIIHNEQALHAVRHYTKTNPDHWPRDRNNPDGLLM